MLNLLDIRLFYEWAIVEKFSTSDRQSSLQSQNWLTTTVRLVYTEDINPLRWEYTADVGEFRSPLENLGVCFVVYT